jgi:hypothetical protein
MEVEVDRCEVARRGGGCSSSPMILMSTGLMLTTSAMRSLPTASEYVVVEIAVGALGF